MVQIFIAIIFIILIIILTNKDNFMVKGAYRVPEWLKYPTDHRNSNHRLSKYIQPTGLRIQHGRPLNKDYLYGILGWPLSDWKDTARFDDTYTKSVYQYAYLPTINHFSPYW